MAATHIANFFAAAASGAATSIQSSLATAFVTVSGDFILALIKCEDSGDISGASDLAGNTYTLGGALRTSPSGGARCRFAWCIATSGHAANRVTGSFTASVTWREIAGTAWSGIDTTSPFDVEAWNASSGASVSSGTTATTAQANSLALGLLAKYGATNPTSWQVNGNAATERRDGDTIAVASYDLTATGAYQFTAGSAGADEYAMGIVVFKETSSSGISADGDVSSPAPTVSGAATLEVAADGAVTSPAPTVASSATVAIAADGAINGPPPAISSAAALAVQAEAAVTSPAPTVAGTAALTITADGAFDSPAPTVSGTAGAAGLTADGDVTSPAPTVAATATLAVQAAGAVSLAAPTVAATGTVEQPVVEPPDLTRATRARSRSAPYPQRGPLARPSSERRRKG